MSAKDTLARWAGDEFMLILPNIQGAEEAIAKVLNLKLVAAGVETEMQEYLLRSLGRQEVQDYLY
jgi:sensor c-di-GMP phosphodiesterase-like protein